MSHLCTILSKQSDFVEFRPVGHSKLHKGDDTFDVRFACFLYLKGMIETRKQRCFDNYSKRLQNYVCSQQLEDSFFCLQKKVRVTVVNVGLSTADRDFLVDHAVQQCDKQETIQVVDIECNSTSAFDLLNEMACSLILKFIKPSNTLNEKYGYLSSLASDNPLQVIDEILSYAQDYMVTTAIVLKHCESLDSLVTSELMRLLVQSQYSGINGKLHLVLVTNALCPLPIPDDDVSRSLMHITMGSIGGPHQIFDDFTSFLFQFESIPIVFPKDIIESLHATFVEFNQCVTSAVNKVLLILSIHFKTKRSILCMYKHKKNINDLSKLRGNADSLTCLLELLGVRDVLNTSISLTPSTQSERFQLFEARTRVNQNLFTVLKYFRDKVTSCKTIVSIVPSTLLWSAISDGKQSHRGLSGRVLYILIDEIKKHLPKVSLKNMIEILTYCKGIMTHKLNQYHLKQYENAAPSSTDAQPEASITDFVKFVVSGTTRFITLLQGYKTQFMTPSAKRVNFIGISDQLTSLNYFMMMKNYKHAYDNKQPFVEELKFDIVTQSIITKHSQVDAASVVKTHCIEIFNEILQDINSWFDELIQHIRRLSPVRPIDGVYTISDHCKTILQECADDNIQYTFSTALENPVKFVVDPLRKSNITNLNLDCQIIYDEYKKVQSGVVVANEWIKELNSKGWKEIELEPPKKKTRNDSSSTVPVLGNDSYSELMRCRFASTLNDMEKSGMIKCKKYGKKGLVIISREMFAWMGNSSDGL